MEADNNIKYKSFWDSNVNKVSKELWIPKKESLMQTDSNQYWTKWENKKNNYQRGNGLKQLEKEIIESEYVTKKFRFYPNKTQKDLIRKCFNIHRYFYNKAIYEINRRYEERKTEFQQKLTCVHCKKQKEEGSYLCFNHKGKALPWKLGITLPSIRKSILKSDSQLKGTEDEWQCEVPYDTRQLAIKDAITAYKVSVTNLQNGNIANFSLGYKRRDSRRQICWVDSSALKIKENICNIFVRRLKTKSRLRLRKKVRDKLPLENTRDLKIQYDRGSWYLVLTCDNIKKPIDHKYDITALDPGVRTFQTGYTPDNFVFKMGEEKTKMVSTIYNKIDHLKSFLGDVKSEMKRSLKKRLGKLHLKVSNIINDLHNQCANFLTKNFKNILLPSFCTSKMLDRSKLYSSVNRLMGTLSFYKFKTKLCHLANRYNSNVFIVDESYTTKTCGSCGKLNNTIGGSKTFNCNACGVTLDRDFNGSRNICLKHLL